jgi:hypothetical protein
MCNIAFFHGNTGYANAQLCYVIRTVLLSSFYFRLIQFPFITGTRIWHWFASNIHMESDVFLLINSSVAPSFLMDTFHCIYFLSRKPQNLYLLKITTPYCKYNSTYWVELSVVRSSVEKKSHFHETHITELIWWFQANTGSCRFGGRYWVQDEKVGRGGDKFQISMQINYRCVVHVWIQELQSDGYEIIP